MVKGNKIFFGLKYSLFLVLALLIPLCAIAKENTFNNISSEQAGSNYKVVKKKISLMPITPLAILGLNTYLVNKGSTTYLVTIRPSLKKHNWLIDTVKIRRELIINQDDDFIQNIPVNLYLTENIELVVSVKKLNQLSENQKVSNNNVVLELPYFIVVNNKFNNKIYLLKEGSVKINLDSKKATTLNENIKIKFNQKHMDNLEILIGFKQSPKDFTNLQNYVSNTLANKYKNQETTH